MREIVSVGDSQSVPTDLTVTSGEVTTSSNKGWVFIVVTGQKPPINKPTRIIEEIIAEYAVDANLFRLG